MNQSYKFRAYPSVFWTVPTQISFITLIICMLSESVLNSELTMFCTVTWAITPSINTDLNRLPTKVALHCRQMVLPSLIDDGAKQGLLCLVKRSLTNKGEVEQTCEESKCLERTIRQQECSSDQPRSTSRQGEASPMMRLRIPHHGVVVRACRLD